MCSCCYMSEVSNKVWRIDNCQALVRQIHNYEFFQSSLLTSGSFFYSNPLPHSPMF